MNADERSTLEGLEFYRATLAAKCEGLSEDQVRYASVPPSALTLLGLVQHAAEVERNWFRRVLAGETAPAIYGPGAHPQGHDGGFDITAESSLSDALQAWQREIEQARSICARSPIASTRSNVTTSPTVARIFPDITQVRIRRLPLHSRARQQALRRWERSAPSWSEGDRRPT